MDDLSDDQVVTLRKNICPNCGAADSFLVGPSGGLSQNVYCNQCGYGLNIMGPFGVQVISQPGPIPSFVSRAHTCDVNDFFPEERGFARNILNKIGRQWKR